MKKYLFILALFSLYLVTNAQNDYYFPGESNFKPGISSPEQFLGYPVGAHHTRYDIMVDYFRKLADESPNASFEIFGYTVEKRPQVILTITSEENFSRLEEIRQQHLALCDPVSGDANTDIPVIIQLGYNVHGNEASGGEASLLTAYYLLASGDPGTKELLDNAVIFIEPVLNPDGRDRFATWANMNRGYPPSADPADREHSEAWPGGRTNHYWFDLNRDWLPLTQPESRNRVERFQKWLPNVVTDHHEMGTNSTFFFEPTKKGSENQIVTMENYEKLNNLFAADYSTALNRIHHFYDSGNSFDNSYPGYGSTYADIHGGLAILFEQASSRGLVQRTDLGFDLLFSLGIKNQLFGALTTVRTAVRERKMLNDYMYRFFKDAMAEAKTDQVKAYVFGNSYDKGRDREFIDLLNMHNIKVYDIAGELTLNGQKFIPGSAWVVPTNQPQYKMIRSIFEPVTSFRDSLFYDASAWAMVFAYGMDYTSVTKPVKTGNQVSSLDNNPRKVQLSETAYIFEWSEYYSAKALWSLMDQGIRVKAAQNQFTLRTDGGTMSFGRGSVMIPVPYQEMDSENVYKAVVSASEKSGIDFYSVKGTATIAGPWLGGNDFKSIEKPKVLMFTGNGIRSSSAGEIWHMTDTKIGMPITKIDISKFRGVRISDYNVLILPSGSYNVLGESEISSISEWISDGGCLIATGSALSWLSSNKLAVLNISSRFTPETKRTDYDIQRLERGKHSIGGIFCNIDLDITNPIGFGYRERNQVVFRNSTMVVDPVDSPTGNVAVYSEAPLVSGFITKENVDRLTGSAEIITAKYGRGNIIMFVDDPVFRGCMFGTNKMLINAIFYGSSL